MSLAADKRRRSTDALGRKGTTINLRINDATRDLIDEAAAAVGKSRTEFMLESARAHAVEVLLDQRIFQLEEAHFKAFQAALDNPPRPNHELKKLLSRKAPWER